MFSLEDEERRFDNMHTGKTPIGYGGAQAGTTAAPVQTGNSREVLSDGTIITIEKDSDGGVMRTTTTADGLIRAYVETKIDETGKTLTTTRVVELLSDHTVRETTTYPDKTVESITRTTFHGQTTTNIVRTEPNGTVVETFLDRNGDVVIAVYDSNGNLVDKATYSANDQYEDRNLSLEQWREKYTGDNPFDDEKRNIVDDYNETLRHLFFDLRLFWDENDKFDDNNYHYWLRREENFEAHKRLIERFYEYAPAHYNQPLQSTLGTEAADFLIGNDLLAGDAGADTLLGGETIDLLIGGSGDDFLVGGANGDGLDGGEGGFDLAGYDNATAGVVASLYDPSQNTGDAALDVYLNIEGLSGSAHDDRLTGNEAANWLFGRAGNDTLLGGGGNDILDADLGDDALYGGEGDDRLLGLDGRDLLNGGAGADTLDGGDGFDIADYTGAAAGVTANLFYGRGFGGDAYDDRYLSIEGLSGSSHGDSLTGDDADNLLMGQDGNDVIYGLSGSDLLRGGAGDDSLIGGTGADTLDGGAGGFDLALYDGASAGVVANLAGTGTAGEAAGDSYAGIEGLSGSAFNDRLTGDAGANWLYGRSGHDTLVGGAGADLLDADLGDDVLDGGLGADTLIGGAGNDFYWVDEAGDVVSDGPWGSGTDTVGTFVSYSLAGRAGIEHLGAYGTADLALTGNELANTLTGNAGANRLAGLDGDDVLYGMDGQDDIAGGNGSDRIVGGNGNDILSGGTGRDVFVFNAALDASSNVDRLQDFSLGEDMIYLDRRVFSAFAASGALATGAFCIGEGAATAEQRIVYNNATGDLFYDADGLGGLGQVKFAVLSTGLNLTAGHFMVV